MMSEFIPDLEIKEEIDIEPEEIMDCNQSFVNEAAVEMKKKAEKEITGRPVIVSLCYSCFRCEKKFVTKKGLLSHVQNEHGNLPKKFCVITTTVDKKSRVLIAPSKWIDFVNATFRYPTCNRDLGSKIQKEITPQKNWHTYKMESFAETDTYIEALRVSKTLKPKLKITRNINPNMIVMTSKKIQINRNLKPTQPSVSNNLREFHDYIIEEEDNFENIIEEDKICLEAPEIESTNKAENYGFIVDSTIEEQSNGSTNQKCDSNLLLEILNQIINLSQKFDNFASKVESHQIKMENSIDNLGKEVQGLKNKMSEKNKCLVKKPDDFPVLPCSSKMDFVEFENNFKTNSVWKNYIEAFFLSLDEFNFSKFVKDNLRKIIKDEAASHFTWTGSSTNSNLFENSAIREYQIIDSLMNVTYTKFKGTVPRYLIEQSVAAYFRDSKGRIKQRKIQGIAESTQRSTRHHEV